MSRDPTMRIVVPLLATVVFSVVTSATMVGVALPEMGAELGASEGTYGWIITGYTLTFGIFAAIHGRLGDLYGARRLYVSGIAIFSLASIAVGLVPHMLSAIVIRVLQGAGAAAIPAIGTLIVTRSLPPNRRGAAMSVLLGAVGVAASIGPLVGGTLTQLLGWQWVFLGPGIVGVLAPVAWRVLPADLDDVDRGGQFDFVGATLLSVSVAGVMLSLTVLEQSGFGVALAALMAVSASFFSGFLVWIHRSRTPFVPPSLLRERRYLASAFTAFLVNATRFGTIVLIPILLIDVEGSSPVLAGLVLMPGALALAAFSPTAGRWVDRSGARAPVTVGVLLVLAGNLIALLSAGQSTLGITLGMGLYGAGFGFTQGPLSASVSRIVPPDLAGVGMGIFLMIFFVGGGFGVAMSTTALELMGRGATSWLGLPLGHGAPFSNAILLLTGLAGVALILTRGLTTEVSAPIER